MPAAGAWRVDGIAKSSRNVRSLAAASGSVRTGTEGGGGRFPPASLLNPRRSGAALASSQWASCARATASPSPRAGLSARRRPHLSRGCVGRQLPRAHVRCANPCWQLRSACANPGRQVTGRRNADPR
eukprot:350660-Chlamydomonas_euryale.AAC.10